MDRYTGNNGSCFLFNHFFQFKQNVDYRYSDKSAYFFAECFQIPKPAVIIFSQGGICSTKLLKMKDELFKSFMVELNGISEFITRF